MATEKDKNREDPKNKTLKPDPETLHKTDPQDEMKGPVSSIMQNIKEGAEENNAEDEEDAKKKKDDV